MHRSHTLIQIPSNFTQFLTKKFIKILLENPCTWVTTLFTVKCVTNTFISWPEKTKQAKTTSNLWEVCFSSAAVVSKVLLGCSGHFLFILCHCNPAAHSLTCMIHMQTENCMKCGFSYETDFWEITFYWGFLGSETFHAHNDRMLHIDRTWDHVQQPYLPTDFLTFHSCSKKINWFKCGVSNSLTPNCIFQTVCGKKSINLSDFWFLKQNAAH